jgi:hypothetical protein
MSLIVKKIIKNVDSGSTFKTFAVSRPKAKNNAKI